MADPWIEFREKVLSVERAIDEENVDTPVEPPDNPDSNMSMTREELLAHLDAQQARTETMLARQNAEAAGHLARFEAQMDRGLAQMQVDRQDQKDEARTIRWTVISSTLAIFLALVGTVVAIVSLNSSVVGNVTAAFDLGRSSATVAPPPTPAQKP